MAPNSDIMNIFRNIPPITKNLIIINLIIWLAMQIPSIGIPLERYCALYYIEGDGFHVWQLFTYMFMHKEFYHLFFNMFALFMFGGIIEMTLGVRKYLLYYVTCGLGAALIQEGVFALMLQQYRDFFSSAEMHQMFTEGWKMWQQGYTYSDPTAMKVCQIAFTATIGASGAVYGLLLAFGMLYPNQKIFVFPLPVGIKAKWLIIGYFVIELLAGVYNSAADNVAHFAHLGGMIFGVLMILYWKKRGELRNMY